MYLLNRFQILFGLLDLVVKGDGDNNPSCDFMLISYNLILLSDNLLFYGKLDSI